MLGSIISAGASLLGGYLGQKSAEKNMDKQIALQKEFAQNAIQYKAADAEKAGISKLYAMGAPTTSYSPMSVGNPLGSSIADAGQSIGRAVDANTGPKGRAATLQLDLAATQLEGAKIDNDIKRQQLASNMVTRGQPGTPPGIMDHDTTSVMPGQTNSGVVLKKEIAPAGALPQKSFGVSPEVDMYRTTHGWSPQVPQQLGEAHESQPISAAQWFMRNNLAPAVWPSRMTPPYKAPEGSHWSFDPLFGEYILVKRGGDPKGARPQQWEYIMDKLRR